MIFGRGGLSLNVNGAVTCIRRERDGDSRRIWRPGEAATIPLCINVSHGSHFEAEEMVRRGSMFPWATGETGDHSPDRLFYSLFYKNRIGFKLRIWGKTSFVSPLALCDPFFPAIRPLIPLSNNSRGRSPLITSGGRHTHSHPPPSFPGPF